MSDIKVVRDIYSALADQDYRRLFSLLDAACVITQDPALPWGGRYEGHDGFAAFGMMLTSTVDSTVRIDALFAADGEVIQCGRTSGTVVATGAPFDIAEVHRWTIREGKAVAGHFAIDTAAMLDALRAGP